MIVSPKQRFIAAMAALACVCTSPSQARAQKPQRWALLVGVGANSNPNNTLLGPKNDIPAMLDLLRGRYGFTADHIRVLQDSQSTRAAILDGWEWLIRSANPGDQVLFYYSGHGIDVPEHVPGSKPSGRDSAICPYDAHTRAGLIVGWEIGERIDRLRTDQVVVIVDACNSGSASRDLLLRRRTPRPEDFGIPPLPPRTAAVRGDSATVFVDTPAGHSQKERYIGAARTDQSATEYPFLLDPSVASFLNRTTIDTALKAGADANPNMGALTYFLLQEIRADRSGTATYADLIRRVRADLASRFGQDAQEPQLSGPALQSTAFLSLASGDDSQNLPTTVPIAETLSAGSSGASVRLRALAGATLLPGSVLQVTGGKRWVEGNAASDSPEANAGVIQVTSVTGGNATGTVLSGEVSTGRPLAEVMRPAPDGHLHVALSGDGASITRLRTALSGVSGIEIVPATRPSDVTLYPSSGDRVIPYRGGIALPSMATDSVPALLTHLRAGKQLADLKNPPESAPLRLTVRTLDGREGYAAVNIGDTVGYEITTDHDAYITVLDLAADGSITGMPTALLARANVPLRLDGITITAPAGLDVVKVIATTFPISLPVPANSEAADKMGADGKPEIIAQRTLDVLRARINEAAAQSRGGDYSKVTVSNGSNAVATDGWASAELLMRIDNR